MHDTLPFPETRSRPSVPEAAVSEPMLQKHEWHRFGQSQAYRDVPFAVLFFLQLLAVLTIALVNGTHVLMSDPAAAPSGSSAALPAARPRSRQLGLMLLIAAFASSLLALLWLAMLVAGSRQLVWLGAGGACALALANSCWLLVQGGAAGLSLGALSILACAGCAAFLLLNRHRVEFSVHLLGTVAQLVREYPATVYVAGCGAALQLLWLFVWSAALAASANLRGQLGMLALLFLSFFWTMQLIKAVLHATIAGTVGSWYFLSPNVPRNPTARALRRALTTSFGSLCLGSLVAASLQVLRSLSRYSSRRSGGVARSCCLCLLGFADVLVRFFNEYAYTQVALYGKNFTRASRDTWTLLVHHSGVDALTSRDLVGSALTFGALLSGLATALLVGLWARASFGENNDLWWEAHLAAFAIGYGSVSLVSSVIESGVCALYVCYAEDPTPLATINPALYQLFISQPYSTMAPAVVPPSAHLADSPAQEAYTPFMANSPAAPGLPPSLSPETANASAAAAAAS